MRLGGLLLKEGPIEAFQALTAFQFFPENLPFAYAFAKKSQLWYFILSIPCMKTHAKGVSVTEIRREMLIIVFK